MNKNVLQRPRDAVKNLIPIAALLLPEQPIAGYQGQSSRSKSQRQSGTCFVTSQTGRAPARCAIDVSQVIIKSRFAMALRAAGMQGPVAGNLAP